MNSKSNNLVLGLKIAFYGVIVVLAAIGWFGNKAGLTLNVSYALLAIAILTVVLFYGKSFIEEPKKSIRALAGFAIIAIIFFIAYSSASGESLSKIDVSETYTKFVGGSLTLLYIVGGFAIATIVISEIYSFFK